MNLKKFEKPEVEIFRFKVNDIITTSTGGNTGGGEVPGGGFGWEEED